MQIRGPQHTGRRPAFRLLWVCFFFKSFNTQVESVFKRN